MMFLPLRPRVAVRRPLAATLAAALAVSALLAGCRGEQAPAPTTPTAMMESLLTKSDPQLREQLAEVIRKAPASEKVALQGDQVVAWGLSPDFWTVDGKPAAVLVTNSGPAALTVDLHLGTYASIADGPKAIIDAGEGTKEVPFTMTGITPYRLPPVPPGESRLVIVDVEKTWQPGGGDTRQLGVQLPPASVAETVMAQQGEAAATADAVGAAATDVPTQ